MALPKRNDNTTGPLEDEKPPKPYRFELSRARAFLYSLGLVVAFFWIFVFGILVGRGVPLVGMKEISAKADFFRFLGLGREVKEQPQEAAETWESSEKILQSLDYYEDLTQKSPPPLARAEEQIPPAPAPVPPAATPKTVAPKEPAQASEPPKKKGKAPDHPQTAPVSREVVSPAPSNGSGERFSVLVSSMKDSENAQKLVDQLKSKGYSPRIEVIDLGGGSTWNRILMGSFNNHDAAMRFSNDFNQKEHGSALVIKENNP